MTAKWTIDDDGTDPPWLRSPAGGVYTANHLPLCEGDYAALVADVRAAREVERLRDRIKRRADVLEHVAAKAALARLVDDLAAVVRRLEDGWGTRWYITQGWQWWRLGDSEPMSPGEVAAYHHARRQEET